MQFNHSQRSVILIYEDVKYSDIAEPRETRVISNIAYFHNGENAYPFSENNAKIIRLRVF